MSHYYIQKIHLTCQCIMLSHNHRILKHFDQFMEMQRSQFLLLLMLSFFDFCLLTQSNTDTSQTSGALFFYSHKNADVNAIRNLGYTENKIDSAVYYLLLLLFISKLAIDCWIRFLAFKGFFVLIFFFIKSLTL